MQGFLSMFGVYVPSKHIYVLETHVQRNITSLLQVGLIVSCAIIGPCSHFVGRRYLLIGSSILCIVATLVQIVTTSIGALYASRVLLGMANGGLTTTAIMYISETSPAEQRAMLVSILEPVLSLGGLLGAGINKAMAHDAKRSGYQAQLATLFVVPLFLCVFSIWLPESPRWLASQGQWEAATKSLHRIRGNSVSPETRDQEMREIKQSLELERQVAKTIDWREMFRGVELRRTFLTSACTVFHSATGSGFLVGYGTVFFQASGVTDPFTSAILLQIGASVGGLVALPIARAFGRVPILLVGFTNITITMFITALVYTLEPHSVTASKSLTAMVCLSAFAYGYSIGPIGWAASGEMPSNRLRSYTVGFGMAVGFFFNWLTVFTSPYFINPTDLNWGAKFCWIWTGSNLICLIFIVLFFPETKGRTLEELDEMFYNRLPARKFKRYRCVGMLDSADSVDHDSTTHEDEKMRV